MDCAKLDNAFTMSRCDLLRARAFSSHWKGRHKDGESPRKTPEYEGVSRTEAEEGATKDFSLPLVADRPLAADRGLFGLGSCATSDSWDRIRMVEEP